MRVLRKYNLGALFQHILPMPLGLHLLVALWMSLARLHLRRRLNVKLVGASHLMLAETLKRGLSTQPLKCRTIRLVVCLSPSLHQGTRAVNWNVGTPDGSSVCPTHQKGPRTNSGLDPGVFCPRHLPRERPARPLVTLQRRPLANSHSRMFLLMYKRSDLRNKLEVDRHMQPRESFSLFANLTPCGLILFSWKYSGVFFFKYCVKLRRRHVTAAETSWKFLDKIMQRSKDVFVRGRLQDSTSSLTIGENSQKIFVFMEI